MSNVLLYVYKYIYIYIYLFIYICIYIYTHTYLYTHTHTFRYVIYLKNRGRMLTHIYHNTKRHNSSFNILRVYCYNMQQILLFTVTAEKAVKHIATSKIRKWPHRQTLSASSSCCMNLWIRRTVSEH
jgi:hypothetical protein